MKQDYTAPNIEIVKLVVEGTILQGTTGGFGELPGFGGTESA